MGTVGHYPTVYLIDRSHILQHKRISRSLLFQRESSIQDWPQFPEVILVCRVVWPRVTELYATSMNSCD